MFEFLANIFMAPINYVRSTFFGWSPEEEEVELSSSFEDNGGPSANIFAAMRKAAYLDGTAEGVGDAISDEDWGTLSMREIDAKLLAANALELGDAVGDPFYDLTPFDVMQQTQAEFEAMLGSTGWQAIAPAAWTGVIADADWSTLSLQDIDTKLATANLAVLSSATADPFYALTPAEIDALTDDEVYSRIDAFGWNPPFLTEWDGIIVPEQLGQLSISAIDELLEASALEPIGNENAPFYSLSFEDVQLLPDTAYEALLHEEQAYYEALGYLYNRPATDDGLGGDTGAETTTENDFLA